MKVIFESSNFHYIVALVHKLYAPCIVKTFAHSFMVVIWSWKEREVLDESSH